MKQTKDREAIKRIQSYLDTLPKMNRRPIKSAKDLFGRSDLFWKHATIALRQMDNGNLESSDQNRKIAVQIARFEKRS